MWPSTYAPSSARSSPGDCNELAVRARLVDDRCCAGRALSTAGPAVVLFAHARDPRRTSPDATLVPGDVAESVADRRGRDKGGSCRDGRTGNAPVSSAGGDLDPRAQDAPTDSGTDVAATACARRQHGPRRSVLLQTDWDCAIARHHCRRADPLGPAVRAFGGINGDVDVRSGLDRGSTYEWCRPLARLPRH